MMSLISKALMAARQYVAIKLKQCLEPNQMIILITKAYLTKKKMKRQDS